MNFCDSQPFLTGFSVFVGTVLGIVTTVCASWISKYLTFKKRKQQFLFELDLNLAKIEEWKQERQTFSLYLNPDSIKNYFPKFNFSKAIYPTTNQMYVSGEIYDVLKNDKEALFNLQSAYNDLSENAEFFVHNKIQSFKDGKSLDIVDFHNWLNLYINEIEKKLFAVKKVVKP